MFHVKHYTKHKKFHVKHLPYTVKQKVSRETLLFGKLSVSRETFIIMVSLKLLRKREDIAREVLFAVE